MAARILVLAPHPDDEVVGCAAALRRARGAGDTGFALYLTTGVPPAQSLWPWQRSHYAGRVARRSAEARRVADRMGLAPVEFLDWPARALKAHLGEALARIRAAVAQHRIDVIWAPAWEGAHQDHDAANFLAAQLAAECRIVEYAAYNFAGGAVRSGRFCGDESTAELLTLTPEERVWKRALLAAYGSERGNLAHIRTETEALRPLPAHDYTRRPHGGTLFYERFQWVPIRHPRIDFEPPERLTEALAAFAGRASR
jgi:N-acetylglucosamine malate deacetylase 1